MEIQKGDVLFPWKRLVKTLNRLIFTTLLGRMAAALVSENRLIQLEFAPKQNEAVVGTICIGKVKNIVHNLQAAFVEYRPGVNGYYSLRGRKGPTLRVGDEITVQIARAAVKTKDAVLTEALTLPGRYAVISAGDTRLGISSKITDKDLKERIRTRWEARSLEEFPFGLIVRTNACEAGEEALWEEAGLLSARMERLLQAAASRTCYSVLYQPESFALRFVKDSYTNQTEEIVTDIPEISQELEGASSIPVRLYDDASYPLVKLYRLKAALDHALSKQVWLKSGGYLIIEPTEAMTVIDVNSGKNIQKKSPADLYLETNLEAAAEIAAQLRLRNLSGIIVVDFIDMDGQEDRDRLLSVFRRHLMADPVKTVLVDMTPLGLVEVTRKKVKAPLHEQLAY